MQKNNNNYPLSIHDENDLVLKHRLVVTVLQAIVILASIFAVIRFVNNNQLMLIVDLVFLFVSLISLYYLKKSISNTMIVSKIGIAIFFILMSIMFTRQELYFVGPSWFMLIIVFSFYQLGIKEGIFVFILSFFTILILAQTLETPYDFIHYTYTFLPLLIIFIITYLYESKVLNKERLLYDKHIAQEQLLEEKEDLLQHAYYDNLTKLPNRILFHDRLQQAIVKTNRSNKDFALLFIDLDKFKEINDSLGHEAGDAVLCEIASRLKSALREEDTVSRFGGDEFLCIIEQLDSCESVSKLATKLIEETKRPIYIGVKSIVLTCSIGISIYKKDANNEKMLLRHADIAMYRAKDLGKDTYEFYTPC